MHQSILGNKYQTYNYLCKLNPSLRIYAHINADKNRPQREGLLIVDNIISNLDHLQAGEFGINFR